MACCAIPVCRFFVSGSRRATPEVLQGMFIAAISSLPTQECLRSELRDNRVVRRWRDWQHIAENECMYLDGLSDYAWTALARECDMELADLRGCCLFAAHVSVVGMGWRICSRMRQDPWKRLEGNIDEMLASRIASEERQLTCL